MTKKTIIGFTLGCFDIFHMGHINLLRNAKQLCDILIVGVCSDEYMIKNKRQPIYSLNDRIEILKACKYCDVVVSEDSLDKLYLYSKYKYDTLFVGSDWFNTKQYIEWEAQLKDVGAKVIYLPYTNEISSSQIINKINNVSRNKNE